MKEKTFEEIPLIILLRALSCCLHVAEMCSKGSKECRIDHVSDPLFPTHIFDDGGDLRVMDMTDPRKQMMHNLRGLHFKRAKPSQLMGVLDS